MSGEFQKTFKGLDSAIKQGTARALNRALSSTKTHVVRALRDETGLKTEILNKRIFFSGASVKNLAVSLTIFIARGIPISAFNALVKKVKVLQKNGRTVLHYGITANLGNGRQFIPGAFFLIGKTGTAVIGRKDAFTDGVYTDPSAPKYSTAQVTTNILSDVAKAHESEAKAFLLDTFNSNVAHEIDFAIQKKFDSDN